MESNQGIESINFKTTEGHKRQLDFQDADVAFPMISLTGTPGIPCLYSSVILPLTEMDCPKRRWERQKRKNAIETLLNFLYTHMI